MISSSTRVAGPFTGTGIQTVFPFSFKVFQASDVLVIQTDLTGLETTLALTSQYTVSLNSNQDTSPGGTVTVLTAPPSGYLLTLSSQVQALQSTNLTNAGNFYPSVVNNALDYLTILVQQLAVQVGLAVKVNISSGISPSVMAGYIVALYNNLTNLIAVNSNSANINAAVANATNINTVASNNTNVTNVGASITNVNTVATNIASINTNTANITVIQNASANATAAANSASSASTSAGNANTSALAAAASALSVNAANIVNKDSSTGAAAIPTGTTAQRSVVGLVAGWFRFNTTFGKFEGYNGTTWGSVGGGATGGGADTIFMENGTTMTANYTLSTGKNAIMVGPLVVPTGLAFTVPTGQRLVIL